MLDWLIREARKQIRVAHHDMDDQLNIKVSGREAFVIAILMLLHMLGSGVVNFVMEPSLFDSSGFLVNAASHSQQIGLAVLLGMVTEVLPLGIAIMAFPIFYARSQRMAIWFVALATVGFAVAVVENIGVMSMVSTSQAYTIASPFGREQLEATQVVVNSARNWPHFISRIVGGSAMFVFFAGLLRFSLVPRALAAFGLIPPLLVMASVSLPLFGREVVFPMLAPMGLYQLILAGWLITKGFRARPSLIAEPTTAR